MANNNEDSSFGRGIQKAGEVIILLLRTLYFSTLAHRNSKRIIQQIAEIGVDSVPMVSLMAIFTGMVMGLQAGHELLKFQAQEFLGVGVAATLVRELGPVLTGLIVAGRAGAAMTAEIGTMQVSEEVDALRSMAIDPIQYLIMPRFVAAIIVMPLLTILTDVLGISGGFLIGRAQLNIKLYDYIRHMIDFVTLKDFANGIVKSIVFGGIIATMACYHGLKTEGGARGVGKATTLSVVDSFLLILVSDYFITHILY
ncbi:MAG: ABC transporter permease [Candidatus Omnitrophica bacterium]|nr:ABC transporter permease [Candidatus Omnitrophota bacterium]MBU1047124.1 ABC transporter permease [Candidatus Omnitrophota bacterium]MBU1630798.1 ABC transporter permease [Candidatus Omnitrophota bacterium]MBU1889598.1 ABC transporter permease [Candidatus Omnitrophota bacterium]